MDHHYNLNNSSENHPNSVTDGLTEKMNFKVASLLKRENNKSKNGEKKGCRIGEEGQERL